MGIIKSSHQALLEACETELLGVDADPDEVDSIEDIEDEYEDMEELEDDIECTVEMVNVIENYDEYTSKSKYLVEMGDLARYMESSTLDIENAVLSIANENGIEKDNIYVVVESQEYIDELIQEAKKEKKLGFDKKLREIKNANGLFKLMKTKGIKVAKKKSKKKKKK